MQATPEKIPERLKKLLTLVETSRTVGPRASGPTLNPQGNGYKSWTHIGHFLPAAAAAQSRRYTSHIPVAAGACASLALVAPSADWMWVWGNFSWDDSGKSRRTDVAKLWMFILEIIQKFRSRWHGVGRGGFKKRVSARKPFMAPSDKVQSLCLSLKAFVWIPSGQACSALFPPSPGL